MSTFEDILSNTLAHEGGYVDDPVDRGGETYKGISRVFHSDWRGWAIIDHKKENKCADDWDEVFEDDQRLQNLVYEFYRDEFWEPSRAEELPGYLRGFYFDMCVNHGQSRAVKVLQEAINETGYDIAIDGVIGQQTLNHAPYVELKEVVRERLFFYNEIIQNDPKQIKFRKGWYNRTLAFLT